jgi:hypothetical protein
MNGNAFYSNKAWAKRAMTILVNEMIMFETEDRSVKDGAFGEHELGMRFYVSNQGWTTLWPHDESDLNELRSML